MATDVTAGDRDMRENDGRKLDHRTLEALRLRAIDQVHQGARPEDVAVALGLHRKTVYAWLKKYREGGRNALLARPVPGRPSRLSEHQLRELSALITRTDPRQFDFESALWTADLVRQVIRRKFGVTLSPVSVARQLDKLGMAPQRPPRRAYQGDPDAMACWQRQEYPRIAARAAAAGATIYFAGETGQERHSVMTGARAPTCGNDGRRRFTMISAVAAKGGAPRFAVFDAAAAGALSFTEFCARLVHGAPGPVYLVVDRHPAHRAQCVKDYAAASHGKLELFYLPTGYVGLLMKGRGRESPALG
jgi:transposase